MNLLKVQNQIQGVRTDGNHTKRVVFKEIRGTHEKLLRESHISAILGQHGEQIQLLKITLLTNGHASIFQYFFLNPFCTFYVSSNFQIVPENYSTLSEKLIKMSYRWLTFPRVYC